MSSTTANPEKKMSNEFKKQGEEVVQSASDTFSDAASQARESISDAANQAKEKFNDVGDSIKKYVKDNPWKAVGYSLLAGVVVSQIMNIKKH